MKSGNDVMILKYFSQKMWQKIRVFVQNTASFYKICSNTFFLFKNRQFFSPKIGENRRKL
jgi:glutamine amidotransferase-like uncharacterized protein